MAIYCKVQMDGFPTVWETGKNIIDCRVVLGCNDLSSSVELTFSDPGNVIAEQLIKHTLTAGGLNTLNPPALLSPTLEVTQPTSSTYNHGNPQNTDQWALAIVKECLNRGVTDRGQIAYILGTAQHESNMGQNMLEIASGQAYEGRADLGNTSPGDGVRFKGRGLVQVTGKALYTKMAQLLGNPEIVSNPDLLMQAKYAVPALVIGMKDGLFTGRKVGQYIAGDRQDFYNARRVVNGMVASQANSVVNHTRTYLSKLDSLLQQAGAATSTVQPRTPVESTQSNPGNTQTNSGNTPTNSGTFKGNKLKVTIGSSDFEFFHQGTDTSNKGTTRITGQSVRWVLNRRLRNKTEGSIKLSDLARKVAQAHGVTLQYDSSIDLLYTHIDQSGISDYQLLVREAKRAGLFVSDIPRSGGVLTIKSLREVRDTQLDLMPGINMVSWSIKDVPLDNAKSINNSSLGQEAVKISIDPVTGQFTRQQQDYDRASDSASTGSPVEQLAGRLMPGQDQLANNSRARTKRVQGLPSTFELPIDDQTLGLAPLDAVRTKGLDGVLDRVWLVDSVTHEVSAGKTTLACFSPVEVADNSMSIFGSGPASSLGNPAGTATGSLPTGQTPANVEAGSKNDRIYQAAISMKGFSSANAPGTNNGRLACQWAVNRVLSIAGVSNNWNSSLAVKAAKAGLQSSAVRVTEADSLPGDIILWDGAGGRQHSGIVLEGGGRKVISNSSSKASFSWVSTAAEQQRYYGAPSEYYRLK